MPFSLVSPKGYPKKLANVDISSGKKWPNASLHSGKNVCKREISTHSSVVQVSKWNSEKYVYFISRKQLPAALPLTPLPLSPCSPSLCMHTVLFVPKEGLGSYSRKKFMRNLYTCLKLRLEGVCLLWLPRSRAPRYCLATSPRLSFSQKRNQAFFSPQKKVPEPISHLALSHRFGFITTWLTLKAHRGLYPCPLQRHQQIYPLFLRRNGSLSLSLSHLGELTSFPKQNTFQVMPT